MKRLPMDLHRGRMPLMPIAAILLAFLPQPATGHDQQPPWLDANTLEDGIYAVVRAPRVVRRVADIELTIVIRNMAGQNDVMVEEITYLFPRHSIEQQSLPGRLLPTQKARLTNYRTQVANLYELAAQEDRQGVAQLTQECHRLLEQMAGQVFVEKRQIAADMLPPTAGSDFEAIIEIHLAENGFRWTIRRDVTIPIHPPLPRAEGEGKHWFYNVGTRHLESDSAPETGGPRSGDVFWFAGDQHVHTTYSLDALVLDGTEEDVTDYAATAELMGLDWMMVTDHSNVHTTWSGTEYYTPGQFDAATAQAAAFSQSHPLLALVGQEMGLGRTGFWNLPSHYLAHPFSADSTGYLANPSSGLLYGIANCEPEQVIINRVNSAGGFGFIAHPFDSGTLAFAQWNFNNGATGWAGMEIWSDTNGTIKPADTQALGKWHELLGGIAAPHLGALMVRPGFPSTFPVGLGNSDAHEPGLLAATFTYSWMPTISREEMTGSLMQGHCVASNGPLLFAEANGARIGEVALLLPNDNDLEVWLTTTAEFGPVGDYEIRILVNGASRVTIPPSGSPDFSMQLTIEGLNLQPPDRFVTLQSHSAGGMFHAFTNPIWLQFPILGDMNDDGIVDSFDVPIFVGTLLKPEDSTSYHRFTADLNQDLLLDGGDILPFVERLLE
jgi:hypothetical protein